MNVQTVQPKVQNNQSNIQTKSTGYQSVTLAPVKEQPKKPVQTPVTPVAVSTPQIKIKSRE